MSVSVAAGRSTGISYLAQPPPASAPASQQVPHSSHSKFQSAGPQFCPGKGKKGAAGGNQG